MSLDSSSNTTVVPSGGFQEQVLRRDDLDKAELKLFVDGYICIANNPTDGYIEANHQPTCTEQGYTTIVHQSQSKNTPGLFRLWVKKD